MWEVVSMVEWRECDASWRKWWYSPSLTISSKHTMLLRWKIVFALLPKGFCLAFERFSNTISDRKKPTFDPWYKISNLNWIFYFDGLDLTKFWMNQVLNLSGTTYKENVVIIKTDSVLGELYIYIFLGSTVNRRRAPHGWSNTRD